MMAASVSVMPRPRPSCCDVVRVMGAGVAWNGERSHCACAAASVPQVAVTPTPASSNAVAGQLERFARRSAAAVKLAELSVFTPASAAAALSPAATMTGTS